MKYCCEDFEDCCKQRFIELFGNSEYTVQVYEFKNEDNRCEFVLDYCPFCGKALIEKEKEN